MLGKEIRGTGRGLFHGKSGERKLQQGIQGKLRSAIDQYVHFYNDERFQERFGVRTSMEVRTAALHAKNPEQFPIAENKRLQKYKAKFAA